MPVLQWQHQIKAVFFDLYNTLARFYPPREELQATACHAFGISVSPQGINRGYAVADEFMAEETAKSPLRNRSADGQRHFFAEYERLILQGAGVQVDLETAAKIFQEVRRLPYRLALFDDVLAALEQFHRMGLVRGLISNLNSEGDPLLKSLGLEEHLDFVVTSLDVGVEKPHPDIFKAALERASAAPSQAVHVGDQLLSDVIGARQVGIQPVLIDRYGTARPQEGVPLVHDMEELVSLIKAKKGY